MPAPKKNASAPSASKAEEPDLLSGLQDEGPAQAADDTEVFDLLDGLTEDEGTPWKPQDEDEPSPEGIQGRVKYVGVVPSDYGPEECPHWLLEAADGTVWSVRGYSTVLRNQMNKANPKIGDLAACRYFGPKTGRAGREYANYKAVSQPA